MVQVKTTLSGARTRFASAAAQRNAKADAGEPLTPTTIVIIHLRLGTQSTGRPTLG
jgi:hypothetical protein